MEIRKGDIDTSGWNKKLIFKEMLENLTAVLLIVLWYFTEKTIPFDRRDMQQYKNLF